MKTKLYFDTRNSKNDSPAPLYLTIRKRESTAFIPLNISIRPSQWSEKRQMVVNHPKKEALNNAIAGRKLELERSLLALQEEGKLVGLTPRQIKGMLMDRNDGSSSFLDAYNAFMGRKTGRTREIYASTLSRISSFDGRGLSFEDVNQKWLEGFDEYLMETGCPSRNGRNIHLRNIRAVFNYAIDEEMTVLYPFRKVKIRQARTRHRAIPIAELRKIWNASVTDFERTFLDVFKLMFFLIGINTIDLFHAVGLRDGRLEYVRRKTHKDYSVRVCRQAREIIERYRGKCHLLRFAEEYSDYRNFAKKLNIVLARVCEREGVEKVTTYHARHSWATYAHRIGVDKDTISLSLGHSFGARVTDTYIDYDDEKVDEANARVTAYLLREMSAGGL